MYYCTLVAQIPGCDEHRNLGAVLAFEEDLVELEHRSVQTLNHSFAKNLTKMIDFIVCEKASDYSY